MSCDWRRAWSWTILRCDWSMSRVGEEAGDSLSFTQFAVFISQMEEAGWRKKFSKKVRI